MMSELGNSHAWIALAASILALGVGPLLHWTTRGGGKAVALLDGFVVVSILCMVVVEIVPHSLASAGWSALLAVGLGILGPSLAEGRFGMHGTHRVALWVAILGMGLHAATDGLAISSAAIQAGNHALEYAVVLHRLPVGLAIWWLMQERKLSSTLGPWVVLAAVGVATLLGFLLGEVSTTHLGERSLGLFEAFVGGLLLHVVSHGVGKPAAKVSPRVAGVGGMLGFALVGVMFWNGEGQGEVGHSHAGAPEFWLAFLDIFIESAPALLIAYGLAGMISSVLGEASMRWLSRGGRFEQAMRGVVFGLPLPLCSCGVVPVYQSLVKRGVPAAAAFAFLVATPELGLDAVLLSLPLLGTQMALVRVIAAFLVALGVGWLVSGFVERKLGESLAEERESPTAQEQPISSKPWSLRIREGISSGFGDVLDGTGPWVVLGLVVAASLMPWLDPSVLTRIPKLAQVSLFAEVGMPIYVCATGATPMVAVMIAKGLSPGAALAFLLTGPATNATTFGVIKQVHGKKVALLFAISIVISAVSLGYAVDFLLPLLGVDLAVGNDEHAHAHEYGALSLASAWLLGGLFVLSFLRQGPRRYLGRLWESGGHDHEHDDHDHDDHESPSASSCGGGSCC